MSDLATDKIPEEIWSAVANELAFPGVHVHSNSYSIIVERISRLIMARQRQAPEPLPSPPKP